ncbi:DUF2660 domain-containing protein [Rickettsia endosymbiont of Halotydeus destructor]|uniref:DUF2660 domain-containing protein n=1 Tax=Rickettsia endosymbiont of Halotydeus destructor TaxID=2996754 RepID=UPI003BAEE9BE
MLDINILIAITILLLLIIFLIYKKISTRRDNVNKVENTADITTPLGINNKKQEYKKLTTQERIELSWKFLYAITDMIINKFSKEDVEKVHECGHSLLNNGGKYEHVVDLAAKQAKSHAQSAEQNLKGQNLGV